MSRTRKHKYGRKLHHKKRTISRNKIKRKMKIKSRKIKQKFKKSHMRYTKNGMKHRIQRGGGIEDDFKNLMRAYTRTQTPESIYEVTLIALNILNLVRTQNDIDYFIELIDARRKFGLTPETSQYLSLNEVLTIPTLKFISETAFLFRKDPKPEIKITHQNWIEFITHAHAVIHISRPTIDAEDITLLKTKVGVVRSKMEQTSDPHLRDMYAELIAELTAFIITNKDAPKVSYATRTFLEIAPPPVKPVVYKVTDYISREGYQNIQVSDKVLSETDFKSPVKEYLTYRLSNDRTGASDNTPNNIVRFNQKIVFISRILDNHYRTKEGVRPTGIDDYDDATEGKKLLLLLRWLDLIPVFGEGAGEYGKYDYVPDPTCKVSAISGSEFTFLKRKSHCRTCGRCMHKEETRDEKGYKVCIECFELFSVVMPPGPGGSAADAAE